MRISASFVLIAAFLSLSACGTGSTGDGIEVHDATIEAAAQGDSRVVYMAMHNHGSVTDQLTGVSSEAAEQAELYQGTEPVDVVPLYANSEYDFDPDGYHVRLAGLKQELRVGDEIEIVLHFRDRQDLTVNVSVQETGEHAHEEH